ncbi:(2Fe-2S)-binding protein [Aeromicrobium sp.]|uniref:(2Fe-2S)-binding protein n=1 Tax=Aeromicrobium sp. TaxID=1871063 RepID=UPI003C55778F
MGDDALDVAAQLGPFFVVEWWTPDSGWRPLTELVGRPELLGERVGSTRALLADRSGVPISAVEERAAASILFLGLAARLVSPAFGCAALTGQVPGLGLEDLWWRSVTGGPWPMARSGSANSTPAPDPSHELHDRVIAPVVDPILESFASTFALSTQVLWGNVASSLAGAQTILSAARPDRAAAGSQILEGMLAQGPLQGTLRLDASRPGFVRRSCCLFYRVPRTGVCGDCVLDHVPTPAPRDSTEPGTRRTRA